MVCLKIHYREFSFHHVRSKLFLGQKSSCYSAIVAKNVNQKDDIRYSVISHFSKFHFDEFVVGQFLHSNLGYL